MAYENTRNEETNRRTFLRTPKENDDRNDASWPEKYWKYIVSGLIGIVLLMLLAYYFMAKKTQPAIVRESFNNKWYEMDF